MKKKLLSVLLALCMVVAMLPGTALAAEFNDVDGHWGQEAIERWADYGVLNGKGNGVFDPNGVMTRAEFATMLVNMMGYTKTGTKTFTDLDPNAWYADAISKLEAAGVMTGVGGGRIDPKGQITREQAAVMLCRAFGIKASAEGTIAFQDKDKVSPWAVDAMTALSERGMINGVGNNMLSPDGIVNRATAAKLTSNMVAEYVTSDTVLTGEIKGVVIVAKGATVEIKDATVSAPIVVESASVSLTNTKAEEVKVAGEKAAVTADKDSTVTDVSIGGDAPAVEINGKVEGTVTVEEGATAPEIKGDGVKADQVVNNTDADVTVNGETVAPEEGKAGDNTGDTNDDANVSGPSSSGSGKPTTDVEEAEKKEDPEKTENHVHNYQVDGTAEGTVPATCTTAGKQILKCAVEGCPEPTKTEDVPALGHDFEGVEAGGECKREDCTVKKPTEACAEHQYVVTTVEATCLEAGKTTKVCSVCGNKQEETIAKLTTHAAESLVTIEAVEATCTQKGLTAGEQCKVCGKVTKEQKLTDYAEHVFGDPVVEKDADCTHGIKSTQTCENCDTTKTTTSAKKSKHSWGTGDDAGKCTTEGCTVTCGHEGMKETDKTCKTCGMANPDYKAPHVHEADTSEWIHNPTGHWHACKAEDCPVTDDDATKFPDFAKHDTKGANGGCSVCKYNTEKHELTYTPKDGTHHAVTCSATVCWEDHNEDNVTCTYDQDGGTKCVCGNTKSEDPKCICEDTKCTEGAPNNECPVCKEDYSACTVTE